MNTARAVREYRSGLRMLYVEWVDSFKRDQGSVWHPANDAVATNLRCTSCGFVVGEDANSITIASHLTGDEAEVSGQLTIPKVAITKRRRVQVKP